MNEKEYKKHYFGNPITTSTCMCGWFGETSELEEGSYIDQRHPHNKSNERCNAQDTSDCHISQTKKCPKCGRTIFEDGHRMWPII